MLSRVTILIALTSLGCPRVSVDPTGRACTNGECASGYRCHPDNNTCAPIIAVGCDTADTICAWTTQAGSPCTPVGAFLPCVDGREDCRGGCRTCLDSGQWSTCSDPDCELGQLWSCDRCDHDCRELVANAEPTCDTSVAPSICIFVDECLGDWVDADRQRENGCECSPTGNEACDGVDNDCDGLVDDAAVCAGTAVCEDGACVPCTAADPDHCGPTCAVCGDAAVCEGGECVPCTAEDPLHCGTTCQVCGGSSPSCAGGACACIEGSCGEGHFCQSGSCTPCPDDNDDHCGSECLACTGETDSCIDGSCQCAGLSCDPGRWCDAGACEACDVSDHCGASCVQCPPAVPVCAAGQCQCSTGTCPPGQYCDRGSCAACSCPTLFSSCIDQGDDYLCRCSATSCGTGGSCEDSDTACVYADNFDAGTNLLHVCSGGTNNSWAMGEPTVGTCRSTPNCWATNLDGNYNDCELSCVASPTFDTAGVGGRIDVSFWAWYLLEYGWDGVTPRFRDTDGWRQVPPTDGWDVDEVDLGADCTWADVLWPAFGQYSTSSGIGWNRIHFGFDSATDAAFFYDGFVWRIYLETDGSVTEPGFWVDDVEVRITHAP